MTKFNSPMIGETDYFEPVEVDEVIEDHPQLKTILTKLTLPTCFYFGFNLDVDENNQPNGSFQIIYNQLEFTGIVDKQGTVKFIDMID